MFSRVGDRLFPTLSAAMAYITQVVGDDTECRSMSVDRIESALHRIRAAYCLAFGVTMADDRALCDKQTQD